MQTKIKSNYSYYGSLIQSCDLYNFDLCVNPLHLQHFPPMQLSSTNLRPYGFTDLQKYLSNLSDSILLIC